MAEFTRTVYSTDQLEKKRNKLNSEFTCSYKIHSSAFVAYVAIHLYFTINKTNNTFYLYLYLLLLIETYLTLTIKRVSNFYVFNKKLIYNSK